MTSPRLTRNLRGYVRCLEQHGAIILRISQRGHYRITAALGEHQHTFTASVTPSDRRSARNFERDVKGWIRGVSGVEMR